MSKQSCGAELSETHLRDLDASVEVGDTSRFDIV